MNIDLPRGKLQEYSAQSPALLPEALTLFNSCSVLNFNFCSSASTASESCRTYNVVIAMRSIGNVRLYMSKRSVAHLRRSLLSVFSRLSRTPQKKVVVFNNGRVELKIVRTYGIKTAAVEFLIVF